MTGKTYDRNFIRRLIRVALPMSLQSLISSSLTLLDNLMVNRLGELELAAVGLATQSFQLEWLAVFGFCSGCATFYTQFWGVNDVKSIRKVIGIAVMTCLCVGLIFFTAGFFFPVAVLKLFTDSAEAAMLGAEYLKIASVNFILVALTQPMMSALRATEQTKIPMYISFASFGTDLVFNYLLIFGKCGFPMLGLKGAAVATVLARILELVLAWIVIFARKNVLAGSFGDFFRFDRSFAKRVYANAAVTTFNETAWCLAVTSQNAAYGHMGVSAYAAVQATVTIMDLFQMACFSIGDASLIFIGESLGRNDRDEAGQVSRKLIRIAVFLGCTMGALLALLNAPIVALFNLSETGYYYAKKLILIRSIYLPINLLVAMLVSGVLRAGGDTRFAAISESLCMWLWAVPAAFVFGPVMGLPVHRVYIISQAEEIIKLTILFIRYFSGKWMNNMITGMGSEDRAV